MSIARSASEGGTKKDDSSAKFAPKSYSGDRNQYQAFRDSVELFFLVNDKFSSDDKKIAFILSLLNNGEAQTWRTNYLRKQRTTGLLTFPLYSEFLAELDKTFKRKHEEDEALFNLNQMKQLPKEDASPDSKNRHLSQEYPSPNNPDSPLTTFDPSSTPPSSTRSPSTSTNLRRSKNGPTSQSDTTILGGRVSC